MEDRRVATVRVLVPLEFQLLRGSYYMDAGSILEGSLRRGGEGDGLSAHFIFRTSAGDQGAAGEEIVLPPSTFEVLSERTMIQTVAQERAPATEEEADNRQAQILEAGQRRRLLAEEYMALSVVRASLLGQLSQLQGTVQALRRQPHTETYLDTMGVVLEISQESGAEIIAAVDAALEELRAGLESTDEH